MKTIFEKIIDREIPADIVYEDDLSLAFLDINPVTKGHTLLISKHPYPWMTDVPDQIIAELFINAKKIMTAQKQGIECDLVQVVVVGEEVPHFHIHLIPRMIGDSPTNFSKVVYNDPTEKELFAKKISNSFSL